MADVKQLRTMEDLTAVLAESARQPVLIYKHSTACAVSSRAYREWQAFLTSPEADRVRHAWVRVIEERPVSLALSQRVGVAHQSPQALLIKEGRALWHASHREITADALRAAVERA
ncbi:MAG: bacillithiol system redox-active protein YtxJ [Bacillota bacterium]